MRGKHREAGGGWLHRLLSGGIAALVAIGVVAGGVTATPAQAQECHPDLDLCREDRTSLENFVGVFVGVQANVTGPDQPTLDAVAAFTTAVLDALASREQAITSELNAMRVADATAALRGVMGSRNLLRNPDPRIRWEFVREAASAAYLADSMTLISAGNPETVEELGQVGMAAYALYVTGTVATGEDIPQPDADAALIAVLEEFVRFLRFLRDLLEGRPHPDISQTIRSLEEAIEQIRNREHGGGGSQVLEYVALGDSYASGTGAGVYTVAGPSGCRRSSVAYAALLNGALTADGRQVRSVNVACHGAISADYYYPQLVSGIEGPQYRHLSRETTGLVTVSMGGNDLGFADIVRACLANLAGFCGVGAGNRLVPADRLEQVKQTLTIMYINILSRIRPDGQLVVLNYPNPAPPRFPNDNPCWVTDRLISEAELAQIDDLVIDVRLMIDTAVAAVGSPRVQVVDMYDAFRGHEVCTNDSWSTSLVLFPSSESFHPKAAGHREYARRLAQALGLTPRISL